MDYLFEYRKTAVQTEPDAEVVIGHLLDNGKPDTRRICGLHAAIGLCTEAAQLMGIYDRFKEVKQGTLNGVAFRKKIGDAFWYAAIFYEANAELFAPMPGLMAARLGRVKKLKLGPTLRRLVIKTGALLHLYKDLLAKDEPMPHEEIVDRYHAVEDELQTLCYCLNFELSEVLEENLKFLRETYSNRLPKKHAKH